MSSYKITFITPLFGKGVFETPEVRPPSIRGQLHWWFRALGGTYDDEKAVFGGAHKGATASKVVVRVSHVQGETAEHRTLPHKHGGMSAPKAAFSPGSSFELHVLTRGGGFALDRQKKHFERSLAAWMHLGTLGLRATRAAGSFVWEPLSEDGFRMPATQEAYEAKCREFLAQTPLRWAVLDKRYESAENARRVVSDTLGGRDDRDGESDLARLNFPLGKASKGRKTSPLRFRIVSPGNNGFHIAAVWDDRQAVTGNRPGDLEGLVRLLQRRKPKLGEQLMKIIR
jgi:CRISPR type III-B/RAMP module RAMP protein Cmr1